MHRQALWLFVLALTLSSCGWSEYAGAPQEMAPLAPSSAAQKGARTTCEPRALKLAVISEISQRTGQSMRLIKVKNRGPACVLKGYPSVRFYGPRHDRIPFVIRRSGDQMVSDSRPQTVHLRHGGTAWFGINRYRCDFGDLEPVPHVVLHIRGVDVRARFDLGWSYCGAGDPGSKVHVSPFTSSEGAAFRFH